MVNNPLLHRYSDGVYNKCIALLGPCSPPLGGVSVHIQRVKHKFAQQNNRVFQFNTVVEYRYRYLPLYLMKLVGWLVRVRPHKLYYHTSYVSNSLPELLVLIWLKKLFNYELIIVEHDCRHLYARSENFKKQYRTLMNSIEKLVLIGSVTEKSYQDAGIPLPRDITMEAAFLPPNLASEQMILKTYPASLHAFMLNHQPLILANAFQLSCLQGKDLYGIDLCLHMLNSLSLTHPRLGFILALGEVGDEAYFRQLCFMAYKMHLADRLYILTQQRELWPLLKKVDLFVRPTLSDGASVSVQEAVHFGTATVASDACLRPEGTMLFSTGNVNDFIEKVRISLAQ